jgi:hypothetical protein
MHLLCVRSAAQLGTAQLYEPACAFWDCAHRSPPDWAHTRPHLHRDQVHPPTHICNWTESTPCPPLHCERVQSTAHICTATESIRRRHLRHHCPPGHLPPRNTSVAHNVLHPHALCCNRVPPMNNLAADCTCCNRLPRCRATGCIRSIPSERSEGAAGRIVWRTRVRGTGEEDWLRR